MGWWFGRKSAPADARPFVPAWLNTDSQEEGFARSVEGMSVHVKSDGVVATFREGAWEMGVLRGSSVVIAGQQVVGARLPGIAAPIDGVTVDAEARTVLAAILGALREHGLINV